MYSFLLSKLLPTPLQTFFLKQVQRKQPAYILQNTYEALRSITSNELLIKVLCGQMGDYGLPPKQSVFFMHALIAKHYLWGGYYPIGGASTIARAFLTHIESLGSNAYPYADVDKIIIRNQKVAGVRMKDGSEILAKNVISNTGFHNTFTQLISADVADVYGYTPYLNTLKPSMAYFNVFIGLNETSSALGLPKANFWIYPDCDWDEAFADFAKDPDHHDLPLVYCSFPSAKDPDFENRYPGKATIELITGPAFMEQFLAWQNSPWSKRGPEYEAFKDQFAKRMIAKLIKQLPQLEGKIAYYETSTPLSVDYFCRYQFGEAYGLNHDINRFNEALLKPKTKIPGLYLTGQDILTCGVVGAQMAGLATALSMDLFGVGKVVRQLIKDQSK